LNRLQRALAITLVVGVGLAAGFLSYRLQSGRALPPAPAVTAQPDTDTAAALDAAAPAPLPVPSVVPDLTFPDLKGIPTSLHAFAGTPLIINFWATWCAPCRKEIPLLRELRQHYRNQHLEVVGIALDFDTAVQQYLRKTPIDYPVLIGEQGGFTAAQQFGVQAVLPFSVFADSRSRIVAVKVGELHREEADFILAEIGSLDRGQVGMDEARGAIEARLKQLAVERAKAPKDSG
jgi:thiol-disulfide isomerase/thioredoxin